MSESLDYDSLLPSSPREPRVVGDVVTWTTVIDSTELVNIQADETKRRKKQQRDFIARTKRTKPRKKKR